MDPLGGRYLDGMTTTTSAVIGHARDSSLATSSSLQETSGSSSPSRRTSLRAKALVAGAILAAFLAFSLWIVAGHGGYAGFLSLVIREPWALQMLVDLVVACSFGIGWMVHDARKHGITTWPFVIVILFTGSVGLLGYVVWRGFSAPSRAHDRRALASA